MGGGPYRQMLSTMQEAMKLDIIELQKAEMFGVLMAVFLWIYGFMSPVAGMIADKVSRKWLIVGSLFVCLVCRDISDGLCCKFRSTFDSPCFDGYQ